MKKLAIISIAAILSVSLLVPPASAGSRQKHRWEGVAIGLGAAILGSALISHNGQQHRYQGSVLSGESYYPSKRYRRHDRRGYRSGHWEMRKTWVSPDYEKVWNPGHYNRRGVWKPGRWITIERRPGYWEKHRVRVSRRHR